MTDRRLLLIPLAATLLFVAYLAFLVFRPFFLTATVAASVALLLAPLQRRLTAWFRGRPTLAAGLLVLVVTLLILLPITAAAGLLSEQALRFFEWAGPRLQPQMLRETFRHVVTVDFPRLGTWIKPDEETLTQLLSGLLSTLVTNFNAFIQVAVARFTSAVFELFLFAFMLFFLLRDGATFRRRLQEISPVSTVQEDAILAHLERTVMGVLLSMLVVPVAQGMVAFVGFRIFGVPSPFLWSVVVMLAALVPILGSPLGWVPAVAYLFANGATWQWVGMLLFGLLGISGIDNVIKPLVLHEWARIHPLFGFLSILGGVMAFGPMGFLVGPVILSLVLSGVQIYRSDVLHPLRPSDAPAAKEPPPTREVRA
jgi:predicted PurR-regulated permease PerM